MTSTPVSLTAWIVSALLGLFFVLGAAANAYIVFVLSRRAAEGERVPSLIPIAPGLAGFGAFILAPVPEFHAWAWLPLLLDVGCGPYLVLVAVALTGEWWKARKSGAGDASGTEDASLDRNLVRAVRGCLVGTAVGDALGLPMEGLSRRRQARLFPDVGRHHFLPGRGMVSDDTEHACMTAQALIASGGEPREFARGLGWRLRFWILGLPAGIGLATLRGIVKLWIGFPPRYSGVRSAGNGPAMRSPIIGVCFGNEPSRAAELVRASTRITHTDPRAEHGALAVAAAAHCAACSGPAPAPREFLARLDEWLGADAAELKELLRRAVSSVEAGQATGEFAVAIGIGDGVTGYINHTVPVALHAWLRYPGDFRRAVSEAIRCGGDTDTVAAIAGAICGAGVGREGIPAEWIAGIVEWPRSIRWIEGLADTLARVRGTGAAGDPPGLPAIGLLARNVLFLFIVLVHGIRRVFPPY